MSKRSCRDISSPTPPAKRARTDGEDRISRLSDEIALHILSYLPIESLITCQRLSSRFHALAGDSELWKRKYYSRWVWPRVRRIKQVKETGLSDGASGPSLKLNKWLDHEHLLGPERTNWKRQYRLRHNWSKGSCRVTELEVAQPPVPPVLAKLCRGVVFTADSQNGLRTWATKDTKTCLGSLPLSADDNNEDGVRPVPTSITVISKNDRSSAGGFTVAVGFEAGNFGVFSFDTAEGCFNLLFSHSMSSNGPVTALAMSSCYLLALSQNETLSLFRFRTESRNRSETTILDPPQLITSLKANNILAPLSLSIRNSASDIIATIAYTFSWIGCGWSAGLQELRLGPDGENLGSRLATTVDLQFIGDPSSAMASANGGNRRKSTNSNFLDRRMISNSLTPSLLYTQPPTALSYSHPYLLASHADNTLTMYLVVSTSESLDIKAGRRLWGHTSSVSGVEVSDRGKAVSVSSRGDEIRIWELEDTISMRPTSRRALQRERSVQISPDNPRRRRSLDLGLVSEAIGRRGNGLGLALQEVSGELKRMRGWVGFDDEQVVVLREQNLGTQLLDCYDFT